MHEVLVNRLGGLSLPGKVWLTDRPDMTLDVYRGRKNNSTTTTTYGFLFIGWSGILISPGKHYTAAEIVQVGHGKTYRLACMPREHSDQSESSLSVWR